MIIFSTAELLHRASKKSAFMVGLQVRIKELLSDEKAIFPRWEREVMGGSLVVDIGGLSFVVWFRMVQVGEAEYHQVGVYLVVSRCGGHYLEPLNHQVLALKLAVCLEYPRIYGWTLEYQWCTGEFPIVYRFWWVFVQLLPTPSPSLKGSKPPKIRYTNSLPEERHLEVRQNRQCCEASDFHSIFKPMFICKEDALVAG